ncbi:Aminodeoxychorismate synthase component 1 [Caloramator mitchellensis]|uniref:aminodeoxychorismate synthase n=1 Tax=Caloramator mitchellensis TaxID=908809 RepID=A0A0R3JXW8_CALMK|nr:aminodeoxychorismate synthase component I [Caloramator mitchellensis]KRQ87914.1 Aminodeoxychorismate synthase component 1 [Caloramator mitchellensis]
MFNAKLNYIVDAFSAFNEIKKGYSMLLDSRFKVRDNGDYSIIVFNPKATIKYINGKVIVEDKGKIYERVENFLSVLDEYLEKYKKTECETIFNGGFVGYFSYDFGMELMNVELNNIKKSKIPDAFFGYYDEYVVIDHREGCMHVCAENEEIIDILEYLKDKEYIPNKVDEMQLNTNFTKEDYKEGVEKVREYIRQGEVYQVNISQQFYSSGIVNPYDAYAILRNKNYGPYNAFLEVDGGYILSTSPEQFIRKRGNFITTRPIKGTTKKSNNKEENERLKTLLLKSEKIKSELLMIIDLERNDLSKICIPGTVNVVDLFEVEEYATVNHLVSTIQGKLLENIKFSDIIKAMFPGGSITGAPKLRSMQVIEEIENMARGIYTGSIGYISNNGNFDFNIAIRTVVIDDDGIRYNVGGGIVWDSDPEDEYEETLHKGRALYNTFTGK